MARTVRPPVVAQQYPGRSLHSGRPGIGGIAVLALASLPVSAAEYALEYGVEAGYEYNDNVRLLPEDEINIAGARVSVPARLTSRTERLEASLDGEMVFSRFDREEYNSDDQSLEGRASYDFERGELEGNAGLERDSTRDSEFLDTGAIGLSAVRREQLLGGVSGMHMFTELTGISAGIDYADVDYDGDRYQPYGYGTAHAGLVWQVSERTRYHLQAYGMHFDSDGVLDSDAEGVGGQLGFETQFSDPLSLRVMAGWVDVESEYRGSPGGLLEDSDEGHLLLDALLEYKLQRSRLRLGATSMPRPSGNGYLQASDQLELGYRYDLSERSRIDLQLTAGQRDPLDEQFQGDRDYGRIRLRLDYRITQSWFVTLDYRYSYQDPKAQDGDAYSNAVVAGLKFQPGKSVWSR